LLPCYHKSYGRSLVAQFGALVDIADHLTYHDSAIRAWVYLNIFGDRDLQDDAYQNIVHAMIEYHAGGYDHDKGELLTPLWPYLRGIAFRGYKAEYAYGITEDLDELQEIAEDQERDRLYLEPLQESPIPGLRTPRESTLPPEDQELVEKLMADLSDEDRAILLASYDLTERAAAEYLGMAKTTYRERLARARERAQVLVRLLTR
jgi:RNA polymerase sigma factor (sigma-70 family)